MQLLPRGEALQSFAQDVAVSNLPLQPAVKAEETVQLWVAYLVNLKFEESVVNIALKSRDEKSITELHIIRISNDSGSISFKNNMSLSIGTCHASKSGWWTERMSIFNNLYASLKYCAVHWDKR